MLHFTVNCNINILHAYMLHFDISFNNKRKWNAMSPFQDLRTQWTYLCLGKSVIGCCTQFSSYWGTSEVKQQAHITIHIPERGNAFSPQQSINSCKVNVHKQSITGTAYLLCRVKVNEGRGEILLGGGACKHFHFSLNIQQAYFTFASVSSGKLSKCFAPFPNRSSFLVSPLMTNNKTKQSQKG